VIRNRDFAFACLATLLMSATFFAALMYLPQFMQKILGWSPLEAGAGFLPMMATFAAVSFAAGGLYERLGAKVVLSAGAASSRPAASSSRSWTAGRAGGRSCRAWPYSGSASASSTRR
jgi:Na+/melibiose symporter-like transporter